MEIQERFNLVKQSKTFNNLVARFNLAEEKVLDLGCGYGEYLNNFGPGSLGITTTPEEIAYAKNLGLNIIYGNVELIDSINLTNRFAFVWCNNLLEHLLSPHAFLMKLRKICNQKTILILGVPIIPKFINLLKLKKFRGALASNHINFFTKESLKLTLQRAGWEIFEIRPFVFKNNFLDKILRILSPHLYVIAKINQDFAYPEKKLKEWQDDPYYSQLLRIGG